MSSNHVIIASTSPGRGGRMAASLPWMRGPYMDRKVKPSPAALLDTGLPSRPAATGSAPPRDDSASARQLGANVFEELVAPGVVVECPERERLGVGKELSPRSLQPAAELRFLRRLALGPTSKAPRASLGQGNLA